MSAAIPSKGLDLPSFSDGDLVVGATRSGHTVSAHFMGNADLSAKPRLDAFFARLHAESLRLRLREVVLDFRKLEFMNSSCMKTVTTWLLTIENLGPANRYSVVFMTNASHWQTRSAQALKYFAPSVVRIESPTPPAR